MRLLREVRVVLCLGQFAWDAAARLFGVRPKPRFGHGTGWDAGPWIMLGCFHPSQQNTFTGVLTEDMIDEVLQTARDLAG